MCLHVCSWLYESVLGRVVVHAQCTLCVREREEDTVKEKEREEDRVKEREREEERVKEREREED